MKVLLCHNHYQQPGGEDQVFADEGALLEANGHEVIRYTLHNDSIKDMSRWSVARNTVWNRRSFDELRQLFRGERPELMHCTNTFPLISPSAYFAAKTEGVAVVQSLHNYRLLCPKASLLRNGRICNDCLGKRVSWPAVVHGCYRNSRSASTVVTAMLAYHRSRKTWTDNIDRYIALSDFSRQKFIEGGLPASLISVKPNFVYPDPGVGDGKGRYAVFVGRLSEEKGLDTLLRAWQTIGEPLSLKIVGDGPLADTVQRSAAGDRRVEWLGWRPIAETLSIIGDAACLIMPSTAYETFGRTIIEAFAKSTPAIVARHGAMQELVDHGRTGLHVEPGDPAQLSSAVLTLFGNMRLLAKMRGAARQEYESRFTAEDNYSQLINIYKDVIQPLPNKAA